MENLLTGQCKADFEKWWKSINSPSVTRQLRHFKVRGCKLSDLTTSMIFGVIQDFFEDSNIVFSFEYYGMQVDQRAYKGCVYDFQNPIAYKIHTGVQPLDITRKEVLNLANKIYNENTES
jgi:hypothetical protein